MRVARHGSRESRRIAAFAFAFILAVLLGTIRPSTLPSLDDRANGTSGPNHIQKGVASYYADEYHGKITASGEVFDMHGLTAAHRTYPFGTIVRVTRLDRNQSVEVRINDRGPFVPGRIIDLSLAAARKLDMEQVGITQVRVEVLNGALLANDSSARSFHRAVDFSSHDTPRPE